MRFDNLVVYLRTDTALRIADEGTANKHIRSGRLTRSTLVNTERSEVAETLLAGDVPELDVLFRQIEAETGADAASPGEIGDPGAPIAIAFTAAIPPADETPDIAESGPIESNAVESESVESDSVESEVDGEGGASEAATAAVAEPGKPPGAAEREEEEGRNETKDPAVSGIGCIATLIIVGILVLGVLAQQFFGGRAAVDESEAPPVEVDAGSAAAAAATEAAAVDQDARASEIAYVTRTINVRSRPDREADERGELKRGTRLTGSRVYGDGRYWLRLETGPYLGGYVSANNLAAGPPPDLTGGEREMTAAETAAIHASPDSSVARIGTVRAGEPLTVVGVTSGKWAEILLPEHGVGYIPLRTLADQRPPAGPQHNAPTNQSPALPPDGPTCESRSGNSGDITYCRDGFGRWVAQGAPQQQSTPVHTEPPAPRPDPVRVIPPYVTRVDWTAVPNPDQDSQGEQIAERVGQPTRVRLNCAIDQNGRLSDCEASDESPRGQGVAAAGLQLSRFYRVEAVDNDGAPTAGRRIRFNILFEPAR